MIKALVAALSLAFLGNSGFAQELPKPEKLSLWPADAAPEGEGKMGFGNATLTVHLADPKLATGMAVVICPGGGYGGLVTGGEGHGIADWLNKQGIAGMVLEYRLPRGNHHLPLLDAQQAIRTVREKSAGWKLNAAKVGIIGFSAGGHLASSAATLATKPEDRPNFAIMVYPVISMGSIGHGGSIKNLLGENPSEALVRRYSADLQVTAETPPCFLTHAVDDKVVNIEHSRNFSAALKAKNISCELLELPSGGHGLNGYKGPMWDQWQAAAAKWLAKR